MSTPMQTQITPVPTDEEAVAITAAVHAMWPTPMVVSDSERVRDTAWKFSGRWWNRPIANRRERPYYR